MNAPTEGRARSVDRLLIAVVLLACHVRIVVMIYVRAYHFSGDHDHWNFAYEAGRLARSLATGAGFSSPMPEPSGPSAFLPIGYPFLLSVLFRLFGVYTTAAALAALTLNILFSTLTCAGVYLLGRKMFGRPTGIVACAILAVDPPSIWYSATWIWDTTLLALALVAAMLWLYHLPRTPSLPRMAATGAILGLVALINPAPIPFYGAVALLLWWKYRALPLKGTPHIAALTAAFLLVYGPWLVRNRIAVGVLAPRTGIGLNLRMGNNERMWKLATGGYDVESYPSNSREEGRQFYERGEVGYDRWCQQRAVAFIAANPAKFAQLTWFKIRAWWFGLGLTGAATPLDRLATPVLRWVAAIIPVLLFVVGCFFSVRNRKPAGLVIALVLLYPLPYYLFFVAQRYRFPVEPFLVLLCAYGIVSACSRLRPGTAQVRG